MNTVRRKTFGNITEEMKRNNNFIARHPAGLRVMIIYKCKWDELNTTDTVSPILKTLSNRASLEPRKYLFDGRTEMFSMFEKLEIP